MHAVEPLHSPTPEEIMEYVDGEGAPSNREAIAAHLAACATCRAIAADQRTISDRAHAWTVSAAPASLQLPVQPPAKARLLAFSRVSRSRAAIITFSAVAAGLVLFTMSVGQMRSSRPVPSPAQSLTAPLGGVPHPEALDAVASPRSGGVVAGALPAPQAFAQSPTQLPRASSVIRTATLRIVVKEFAGVRQNVERVVEDAQGFIDRLTVTGDTSSARELRGTLRVPGDRLAAVLTRLRALGAVTEDTQGSEDVTDQIVDLDARLASARATEKRLTELLANRTGRLADVLDVEREITRVRLDIERLDAEKTNIGRRVTYATIGIAISEERKAGVEVGPLSLATRIRVAALDGIENVIESIAGVVLLVLRVGPALLFWSGLVGIGWLTWRAIRTRRSSASPGSPA